MGEEKLKGAAAGEPAHRHPDGRRQARRLHPRHRGHDGAAKSDRLPDRCEAAALARELLVRLAHRHGVRLRQSYTRLGKIALIRHQRYAHAKQLKRANRMLQTLRTQLGRVIRDIVRKIAGNAELRAIFARPLSLASQVRSQKQRQRGPKIYSQHAPEVACIGKGKAHRPYEFGVKVSVATTLNRSKGGQFVAHVAALPGNPYDGTRRRASFRRRDHNEIRPQSAHGGQVPAAIRLPPCSPASSPLRAGYAGGLRPGLTQAAHDGDAEIAGAEKRPPLAEQRNSSTIRRMVTPDYVDWGEVGVRSAALDTTSGCCWPGWRCFCGCYWLATPIPWVSPP